MGLMILASPEEDTVASKKIVFSISITNVIALLRIEDDGGVEDRPGKTHSVGFECDAVSSNENENA